MEKEIVIFSDVEMGMGTLTDDFVADDLLSELIIKIGKSKKQIDLIFNGDTFDFLKCPIIENGVEKFPKHITADISLTELESIYNAHKKVFLALKKFVSNKKNKLYFIIGNHDYDLLFPEIQAKIKKVLDCEEISFSLNYSNYDIYVEHGNLHDIYNSVDPKKIFVKRNKKNELNVPIIVSGFSSFFMKTKKAHPFIERINPKLDLFNVYPPIKFKMQALFLQFFLTKCLYSVFDFMVRGYFFMFLQFLIKFISDFVIIRNVARIIDLKIFYKPIKKLTNTKLFVFGHVHEKLNDIVDNKRLVILDTWRDEYNLDSKYKYVIPKTKRYAKILVEDKKAILELINLVPKKGKLLFEDILKDEISAVKKARISQGKLILKDYKIKKLVFDV
jgi:UDP-2,3-diacylglucosamine pyrophosphatase LpxH